MTAERNAYTGNATQTPNPAKPRRLNLDAIRDRATAATPGPWVTGDRIGLESWQAVLSPTGRMVGLDWDQSGKADAAFIASAREDVPTLLAEVDRLRARVAALEERQPAPVHVTTPEGITPCGEGHHDVTTTARIAEATCLECLRTLAQEEPAEHHTTLQDLTAASAVLDDALNRVGTLTSTLNAARVENARLRRLLDTRDAEYALVIRVGWDGRTQVDGRPGVSLDQAATWTREIADDTTRRAGL